MMATVSLESLGAFDYAHRANGFGTGRDSAKEQSSDQLHYKVMIYIDNPHTGESHEMGYTREGESRPHRMSLANQKIRRQEPRIPLRPTRDNPASHQRHRSD